MKKTLALLLLFTACNLAYSQEICDNGIDDDADGFIDLNDDECDCEGFVRVVTDIIPNPSFEERTCCPSIFSQMDCVNDWSQGSVATSDYFNLCGYDGHSGELHPELPLPGDPGGEGFTGFHLWGDAYLEYVGSEALLNPFLSGLAIH
jgi:hypothetical protein